MMVINKTKYAEIGRKMRALPPEKSGATYEWEELVNKMCASDDAGLHDAGIKERDELLQQKQGEAKICRDRSGHDVGEH